ncbi:MAG: 2OG-Fe(II) oxygenase [Nitrosospira sp.]
MNRTEIADHIAARLQEALVQAREQWHRSGIVSHCYIDNVLPLAVAMQIRQAFPSGSSMKVRSSLRELKYIGTQMDQYDPILEEALYAFQDPRVVDLVGQITGLKELLPDDLLYAGGISVMTRGHFLNPHLDNSHDKNRELYRVLNVLYYVSPDWSLKKGGNLEVWPEGVAGKQQTIESRFNRLAIMVTNKHSWHSVSPVVADDTRCCVSITTFLAYPPNRMTIFTSLPSAGAPISRFAIWC